MAISGSTLREIDLLVAVVRAAAIGKQFDPIVFALLTLEEAADLVVRGKDGGRGAHLGPHVGDHVPIHRRQRRQPRPVILEHAADRAVDVVASKHFEHDILRAHPIGERPHQLDPPHAGHLHIKRMPGHRQGHFESAGSDGQHAHRAGRRRVAVGAHQRLARFAESLLMHRMAHAVAGPAEPEAKPPARAFEKQVVVGILGVFLNQVVIDVLHRQLGADPIQLHRFEFEHHQSARRVLRQGLVDPQPDFAPGRHFPFEQMGFNQLASDVLRHGCAPFGSLPPCGRFFRCKPDTEWPTSQNQPPLVCQRPDWPSAAQATPLIRRGQIPVGPRVTFLAEERLGQDGTIQDAARRTVALRAAGFTPAVFEQRVDHR